MIVPLLLLAQAACIADAKVPALDHVVIAVRDLDRAAQAFRQAGFHLKPGRLHANNLLNRHIKFRDGSEIELMTVRGRAGDAMARSYAQLLAYGDGGVYVALEARALERIAEAARPLALEPIRSSSGAWQFLSFAPTSAAAAVFFGSGGFTIRDADSVVTHQRSVTGLAEAWLEGDDALTSLLAGLGARSCGRVTGPGGRSGQRWALGRGSVVVLPPASPRIKRVIGVVLSTTVGRDTTLHPLPNFWVQYRLSR